ncbi:MAG: glycoside hydrolase family 99-like domain-containing protein [Candidatus Sumerlaeota bacterium]|nr:glycoside hydrolase family 99-like domain-containing protein [Candidatus Sumerlaeota bacterium]
MLIVRLLLIIVIGSACSAYGAESAKAEKGLIAWYRFDAQDALGRDASGAGRNARVEKAKWIAEEGGTLQLEGQGGLEIANDAAFNTRGGVTIDFWLKFSEAPGIVNLISKGDEYMLRVNPPSEGGNIAFFVKIGGGWEPRVSGPKPEVNQWYHIVAVWDGREARVWINGRSYRTGRSGACAATNNPILIGKPAPPWAPGGIKGLLREIKIYNRPLTDGEVLVNEYGLNAAVEGARSSETRFEFARDAQGWIGKNAAGFAAANGLLRAQCDGSHSVFAHPALNIAVANKPLIAIRMTVSQGKRGRMAFVTSAGAEAAEFPIKSDGRSHVYALRMDRYPEWDGDLRALAILPSDAETAAELDFVRIGAEAEIPPDINIEKMWTDQIINRAGRPDKIHARIRNSGGNGKDLTATLSVPPGIRPIRPITPIGPMIPQISWNEVVELSWDIEAPAAATGEFGLTISGGEMTPAIASLPVRYSDPVRLPKASYIPDPQIATSNYLVGAHFCPLWKEGTRSQGWGRIAPYPEREPALGWYDEGNPQVADWEIKWALEHGISFFVYCWYRAEQGTPVKQRLGHAIHEGLFNARFRDKFKFTIMWENGAKKIAGVSSEEDFLRNLLPFWIENYFKHPSYLKIDGKPLLFIYRPEFLVDDLGSVAKARATLEKARQACTQAGFSGLTILGECRGTDTRMFKQLVDESIDYSFAYCWPVPNDPTPQVAIQTQEDYFKQHRESAIIPEVLTLAMGWDSTPWHPTTTHWYLPPRDFQTLCERAKAHMAAQPEGTLGRRIVLLDNWNEFGEGHYIAPHRRFGFGYLDAVRAAFTSATAPHLDLAPEDVGLGPYDSLYRRVQEAEALCSKRVTAESGRAPGLVAWWSFDEKDDDLAALDYTGNGLGGRLNEARRADGIRGKALVCAGGCVSIPANEKLFPPRAITLECWIKADKPDQNDRWFVNCVYGTGDSGYRLGLTGGCLCWAAPKTKWSHHLRGVKPVPVGKWTHIAATYDGKMMRMYMDGEECGVMERGGRIYPTDADLILGNFSMESHAAFSGLLDEVKLYDRALGADEIRDHAKPR